LKHAVFSTDSNREQARSHIAMPVLSA